MADIISYPARLEIDYPGNMDRLATFFRLIWAIPIIIVISLVSGPAMSRAGREATIPQYCA